MKTTVERVADHPTRVLLEVEVPAERLEQAVDKVYRRVAREVRIPGFRPGRAPRPVVELHVGKEAMLFDALDELLPELYREAVRQSDIDPIDRASLDYDPDKIVPGEPFQFTAEVDVKPEVEIEGYEGLELEKRLRIVTDEHVDDVIERIRQNHAQLVNTDKDTVEQDDYVIIDFDGFIEGEAFPGGAGRGETVQAGGPGFIPGFTEQLVGLPVDEERAIELEFPEDYQEDLAGKPVTFKVTVKEIKELRVPELDDELAKDAGEFDTLAEMKADARRRLEEAAAEEAESELRNEATLAVAELVQIDVPEVMIESELEQMEQELRMNMAQSGLRLEDYLAMNEQTMEDLHGDLRPGAETRVKSDLALEAIAAKEELTVDEDEIDARIKELLGPNRDEKEVEEMLADEDRRDAVRQTTLRRKTIDWLVENARVTETEFVPADEADADEADADEADEGAAEETEAADVDEQPEG